MTECAPETKACPAFFWRKGLIGASPSSLRSLRGRCGRKDSTRCHLAETCDWQLQRGGGCGDQKVEPGSTSGSNFRRQIKILTCLALQAGQNNTMHRSTQHSVYLRPWVSNENNRTTNWFRAHGRTQFEFPPCQIYFLGSYLTHLFSSLIAFNQTAKFTTATTKIICVALRKEKKARTVE